MLDALTACADLLEAFGGHAHAAGLAVRRENVAELRRRLNEHAARVLCEGDGAGVVEYDMELEAEALENKEEDDEPEEKEEEEEEEERGGPADTEDEVGRA